MTAWILRVHRALDLKLTPIAVLAGGQSDSSKLVLTARQPGPQGVKIMASAGGLSDQAEATVMVVQPKVSLTIDGAPNVNYVGRPADWRLTVSNPGTSVLNNVVVRDRLPLELDFTAPIREAPSPTARCCGRCRSCSRARSAC